jgi:phosphoribosylanthranilate isomerase
MSSQKLPQVKICGLTRVDEALGCVERGAAAIGLVFYPKSPRHLSDDTARTISRALPAHIAKIGVFVNTDYDAISRKAAVCGLTGVQLHGQEKPDLVRRLTAAGLSVIKALFISREPGLTALESYKPSAFLVECGQGKLPGGNARAWNWVDARPVANSAPLILAGGIDPDNIAAAVSAGLPDAVDLSSGVEAAPGRKDLDKVERLFVNLTTLQKAYPVEKKLRRVF